MLVRLVRELESSASVDEAMELAEVPAAEREVTHGHPDPALVQQGYELLERRLDNVIVRLNLGNSRAEARQLVQHGFVYANGHRVDIPAHTVKLGQAISLKVKEPMAKKLSETFEILKDRAIPKWLDMDPKNMKCKIAAMPTKDDVGFPIQEQLIVELYSK